MFSKRPACMAHVLRRAHKVVQIVTPRPPTLVVRNLLRGARDPLPPSETILSCLDEDFLAGCWKTSKMMSVLFLTRIYPVTEDAVGKRRSHELKC